MIKTTLLCYSLVAFRETRSEPISAQLAAIKVLENRATLNHTSACKELEKESQFSWVEQFGITKPTLNNDFEKQAWQQAKNIALSAKNLTVKGITPQHVYFNTRAMGKRFKTKTKSVVIGNLIFY